jgi:hypothetical protein
MHKDVTCEHCKKDFQVDDDRSTNTPPLGALWVQCPYCNQTNLISWPMGGIVRVNPK